MKKILIVSNAYPSKQKKYSAIFVKNQFEWLKTNASFDIDIFYMKRIFTSKIGSVIKYLKSYVKFTGYLRKRFDVIHIHFLSPLILLPYIYKIVHPKTKTILTMHGSDIYKLENSISKRVYQTLIKRIDTIICVGEAMKNEVLNKLGRKTDFVLSAGINNQLMQPLEKTFEARDIDLLYVGSFYHIKGIDRIIDVLNNMKNTNLKIVFIGSGNFYRDELKQLSKEIDLKIINGLNQKELNDYYNRSKFMIVPSRSEGFGLTLAEALYCGTPVIASNLKQFKFLIKDGQNGFIFEGNDPVRLEQLLRNIETISEQEWIKLSNYAQKSAEEHTLEKVCKKLNHIYNGYLLT